MKNTIPLFWYSTTRIENMSKENFGDLLSKYLVEKISNKKVKWVLPFKYKLLGVYKKHYTVIGSILSHVSERSIVWGSGIIEKNEKVRKATFLAVRGPKTRERLLDLGYSVPEIYGDPAILTPTFYNPKIDKKHSIGIICHYVDHDDVVNRVVSNDVKVINLLTNDIESKIDEILSCKSIISSSLHGVIVGQAYGIPSLWVKFSDKLYGDDIKFQDYYESVKLPFRNAVFLEKEISKDYLYSLLKKNIDITLVKDNVLKGLREQLMDVCPFLK